MILMKTTNRRVVMSVTSFPSPHSFLMAPPPSSLSCHPHVSPSPINPNPNRNLNFTRRYIFPPRTMKNHFTTTLCTLNSPPDPKLTTDSLPPPPPPVHPPPVPPPEKKSFAIATGELFLGLAARFIGSRGGGIGGKECPVTMFERTTSVNGMIGDDRERIGDDRERIAAVVKDAAEPGVVWEQREKDVEAEKERRVVTSPGFSFSAAGLLFPYHLGVAHFLIEKGYIKDTTPLAGSSAGAIVCAVIASGTSMQDALKATKVLADDCRLKGTAFRLGAVLKDVLQDFLPNDAHIRSNGRVRIAVTQILWRPKGLLVDQFDSKEDLINAVITSSFIPGYLAPKPATMFRNRLCIDGGLTLFMPPTSAAKTVRVCAFPANRMGLQGIGISPDCNPENRAGARELFNWALEPAEDLVLDRLFELGYLDAAVWGEQNPVEELLKDDSPHIRN